MLGNAYISGNVMLTTTSSFSRLRSGQRRSPQTQLGGVGGVWWGGVAGNVNIGGNTSITGNTDIAGNVFLNCGEREPAG
jgi:hypothetical protein